MIGDKDSVDFMIEVMGFEDEGYRRRKEETHWAGAAWTAGSARREAMRSGKDRRHTDRRRQWLGRFGRAAGARDKPGESGSAPIMDRRGRRGRGCSLFTATARRRKRR